MLISPKVAIEQGWIKFPEGADSAKFVQPNAIDFTIDSAYLVDSSSVCTVTETQKTHKNQTQIIPGSDGLWAFANGNLYDFQSKFYVDLPEGVAALLILRSTFTRNGLVMANGLYDSGFKGNIGATISTRAGTVRTAAGTRIGQIMFVASDSVGVYAGGYNRENGERWTTG